ncbi:fibronectin type III domain-containing protein [Occultella glacieicola]|uniref:Fibronectin type III domain-containing protein n=1 Tax=Occultella glacieicola TaxID=2518684 RepID=A0ABY2E0A8_9MICO|nr:Ig-like domain-containing protein [Occultella glacieicola]TDE89965.1 fibronectin type III domain-containing protein [Occultella glacieicola]
MSLTSRLARNKRRIASATVISLVVGTVVALSLNYEGVATADVELNDGGVWVSNNNDILVGRLNYPIQEIDASLAGPGSNIDVLQREDVVFLRDFNSNTLQRVSTANVAVSGGVVQLPSGSDIGLGDDTLGVLIEETGEYRVLGLDQLGVLEESTEDPTAVLGEGAVQAVADDGTAYGLDVLDGTLSTFTPQGRAAGDEPETAELDPELLSGAEVQMTVVGDAPVILAYTEEDDSLHLLQPGRDAVDLSGLELDAASATLQSVSPNGDTVALATTDALVRVPLGGGDPQVVPVENPGQPAAPMQISGCTHGAWAGGPASYLRLCGDTDPVDLPVSEATGGELKFRTNRGNVVLNELSSGNSWMIEDALILVDNWEDVTPPQDEEEEEEESQDLEQQEVPLDREAENRPPTAQPDSIGLRAGATVVLPVLDNDSDPDGDLLIASAFDAVPETFGTVEAILGGRALQIRVAEDASGSANFSYTADDGRGGTDTATVDLTVLPNSVNEPPEQLRDITARVAAGQSVTVNVMNDVRDPEGDSMFVEGTAEAAGLVVLANPNGSVTITDPGLATGIKEVIVLLSDGRDVAEVTLQIEVLPDAPAAPQAVFDFATAFVDETITVEPLTNDLDPNNRPLRMSNVTADNGGPEIVPDMDGGTFTFTAQAAGDYYLTYILADDDGQQSTGLIRVNVRAKQETPPVAVADTALLPPLGSVLVDVLQNDSDPNGGVLAVQQIDVPDIPGLQVAVLEHRILRITATRTVSQPFTINYTVSNGLASAPGQVQVLPMTGAEASQPPVAEEDVARVRAGDHVTIPVLANDTHPNGLTFELSPELEEAPAEGQGLMFVAGDVVRFQAPAEAGTVTAVYSIVDEAGRVGSARITIYVQARSDDANAPPVPQPVETRSFAGERIRIPINTYGIDPDGDSVQLLGVAEGPQLGRIVATGPTYLDYQAYVDEAGTDTFSYTVRDRLGLVATAPITVGVIPPPDTNRDPVAVPDEITVRPSRALQTDPLANDTDPDGDQLFFDDPAFSGTGGLEVSIEDGQVAFESPAEAGTYIVTYNVTDRHGGSDTGALTVIVDPDHAPQPPIAVDDVVPASAILGETLVDVVVLENDTDPDGSVEDLEVSIPAGNATAQSVGNNVRIELTDNRQVVTYQVTDQDGLSSYAFIDVPGLLDTGPVLNPDAPPIEVLAGESVELPLEDYVVALSGQPVQLADTTTVRATNSDGSNPVVDATTLQYTSDPEYVGAASLTFEVTDAPDINADGILTSVLTLDITVTSDENKPPRVRAGSLSAEAGGESESLDLSRLADDPDGDPGLLEYEIADEVPGFDVEITDDVILTVSAHEDTAKGTAEDLIINVTDGESDPVPLTVTLTATGSTRELIVANNDDAGDIHQGESTTVDVLANDSNPFPDSERTILSAQIVQGSGTAAVSGDQVTITPAPEYNGRLLASYTVVDVTGDPDRVVEAQISAAVLGRPDPPYVPLVGSEGNREVVLSWTAPNDNGAPITGYTVSGGGVSQQCATTTCTIGGLTNGNVYSFTVTATNEVGESDPSPASREAIPDVKPQAPAPPTLEFGDGELAVNWTPPVNEGTPITSYDVQISPATGGTSQQSVTGTSMTWTGLTNGQTYTFRVRAINDAPEPGDWSGWSQGEYPSGPPLQPAAPQANRVDDPDGRRLTVSWSPPNNNGDAISAYYLTVIQDGAPAAPITLSGSVTSREVQVENGHDYRFTVVAENRSGRSPASGPSNQVRSFGQPGQVTGVSAAPTGADQRATVGYSAPASNGQAISRYEYSLSGGGAQSLPSSGTISTPGADGTSYTVRVRACNTYCGPWSAASASFSTYGPPSASGVDISSSANGRQVSFSWTAPASNNGANITATRWRIDGGGWTVVNGRTGNASTGGNWEQNHTIDVQVRNQHGQWSSGSASRTERAEEDPTPPQPPPVVIGADRGAGATCDGGGSCAHVVLTYQNLPAVSGGYHAVFTVSSSNCGNTFTRDYDGVAAGGGDGRWQSGGYWGTSCRGTVTWTLTGGGNRYSGSSGW